jgi:hypothetical protein
MKCLRLNSSGLDSLTMLGLLKDERQFELCSLFVNYGQKIVARGQETASSFALQAECPRYEATVPGLSVRGYIAARNTWLLGVGLADRSGTWRAQRSRRTSGLDRL